MQVKNNKIKIVSQGVAQEAQVIFFEGEILEVEIPPSSLKAGDVVTCVYHDLQNKLKQFNSKILAKKEAFMYLFVPPQLDENNPVGKRQHPIIKTNLEGTISAQAINETKASDLVTIEISELSVERFRFSCTKEFPAYRQFYLEAKLDHLQIIEAKIIILSKKVLENTIQYESQFKELKEPHFSHLRKYILVRQLISKING